MSFWGKYNSSVFVSLKCAVLRRLKCVIFLRLKCIIFGRLKYLIFEILKYFNFRENALFLFGRRKCPFLRFGGTEYGIFGELKCTVMFLENKICFSWKIELFSFWETESFNFFGKNHTDKN